MPEFDPVRKDNFTSGLMPNKHLRLRLRASAETFLRHWLFEDIHHPEERGLAKKLQVAQRVTAAELAVLIAAGLPELVDHDTTGQARPPVSNPVWPWSEESFRLRLTEARMLLKACQC